MNSIALTPAQKQFLSGTIAGFDEEGGWRVTLAGAAASDRRFLRVTSPGGEPSFILVLWSATDPDWDRFLRMEREFAPFHTLVPGIHAVDEIHGLILEEDLGEATVKSLWTHRPKDAMASTYREIMGALARWHAVPPQQVPTVAQRVMDEETFLWESDYFTRHCVIEHFGGEELIDAGWREECRMLAVRSSFCPRVVIHRDFQSENVLSHHGAIRFVDYQGARLGPAAYDCASMLFDPYVEYLDDERVEEGMAAYNAAARRPVEREDLYELGIQRLMQAAGAYTFLSRYKGKTGYLHYLPRALHRLDKVLKKLNKYQHIGYVLGKLI